MEQSRAAPLPNVQRIVPEEGCLQIGFCRYDSNRLIQQERSLSQEFIAISHVWGDADWRRIDCIDGEIIASEAKALFITNDLRSIVGDSWFWMDILCVDQRNTDARVAVTQHIPSIFRAAIKTIVIQESTSFRPCCVEAAGPSHAFMGKSRIGKAPDDQNPDIDFSEGEDGRRKLGLHMELDHEEDRIADGVLTRLWPLQEIILSDIVQFVRCDAVAVSRSVEASLPAHSQDDLASSLATLAVAWDTYTVNDESSVWHRIGTAKWSFIAAYFQLGEAKRTFFAETIPETPRARDLGLHLVSTRQTSKPRDFILAVMPQYAFYSVPKNARQMSFSELFLDCCHQLRNRDVGIAPLLMDSENPLDGRIGHLSTGIPEPAFLGDLAKLLNGPVQRGPRHSTVELISLWRQPAKTEIAKADALNRLRNIPNAGPEKADLAYAISMIHLIVICIFASKVLWTIVSAELIREIDALPTDAPRRLVAESLTHIISGIDWAEGSRANAERMTYRPAVLNRLLGVPWETAAMVVAMVSCGVPLNSFEWAMEHLEVLHVNLQPGGPSFIALAPKRVVDLDPIFFIRRVDDFANGRDGPSPRLALIAVYRDGLTQCLFPPDLALEA